MFFCLEDDIVDFSKYFFAFVLNHLTQFSLGLPKRIIFYASNFVPVLSKVQNRVKG